MFLRKHSNYRSWSQLCFESNDLKKLKVKQDEIDKLIDPGI